MLLTLFHPIFGSALFAIYPIYNFRMVTPLQQVVSLRSIIPSHILVFFKHFYNSGPKNEYIFHRFSQKYKTNE